MELWEINHLDKESLTPNSDSLKALQTFILQSGLNGWAVMWVHICMRHLTVCSYYVTYMFRVNLKPVVARMSWNSLLGTGAIKFKWLHRDSNPKPLSSLTSTQPLFRLKNTRVRCNPSFIYTILNFPTFRLIQQSFPRRRCWMKNLHNRLTWYISQT